MYTVTFYSYKGGVGRTSALMNTAFRLSKKGKNVFVLDFDLEAPGVDAFSPGLKDSVGLLEFVSEYSRTGRVPELQSYVSDMFWGTRGRVSYMSAGKKDNDYQRALAQLNWKEFYSQERGFLFVENLKGAISAIYSPDYLLVDSRTGMTDISGICTLQLPDVVVLLFGLNEQNLLGSSTIFDSITRNPLNRQIETLLVATPVPDVPEYLGVRQQRLDRAREIFGIAPGVVLPYDPFMAFRESVNPSEISKNLSEQYDKLCNEIIKTNKSDVITMLEDVRKMEESGDREETEARYLQIVSTHPKSPVAWLAYGVYLRGQGKIQEAIGAFSRAEQEGGPPRTWRELALTNLSADNYKEAADALRKYLSKSPNPRLKLELAKRFALKEQVDIALETYDNIIQSPNLSSDIERIAWFDKGRIYLSILEPKRAIECFERALTREPSSLSINYNLAVALRRAGRSEEAIKLYKKAITTFEQQPPMKLLPDDEANRLQAMAQAYIFVGNSEQAIPLIQRAILLAESVSTRIYSSFQYREVSSQDFGMESKMFLREIALERIDPTNHQ